MNLVNLVSAQINPPIPNPKKIFFTYQTVPNVYFIEDKLYGDTLVLKRFLKKTKFQLTKSASDSTKIIGFVQRDQIKKKDLRELKGYISHSFPLSQATFIVNEKKTKIKVKSCEGDCETFFKDFFKTPNTQYSNSTNEFDLIYDDEKKSISTITKYSKETSFYSTNFLEWQKGYPDIGTYKTENYYDKGKQQNAVVIDRTLNKNISPITLFGNCNNGITAVVSKYYTTYLVSISYE